MTKKDEKGIGSEEVSWYEALSRPFPHEAIQRTTKDQTRKAYDTTGIGYQWAINRLNEVCGIRNWGFSWKIIKELEGTFSSGKSFFDITVEVGIWVESPDNMRSCVGGHISSLYADALKGAITNGLKKAAAFFGVGRQAYEGTLDDDAIIESDIALRKPEKPNASQPKTSKIADALSPAATILFAELSKLTGKNKTKMTDMLELLTSKPGKPGLKSFRELDEEDGRESIGRLKAFLDNCQLTREGCEFAEGDNGCKLITICQFIKPNEVKTEEF